MKEEIVIKPELKLELEAFENPGRNLTDLEKASRHHLRMHLELQKEQEAERIRVSNNLDEFNINICIVLIISYFCSCLLFSIVTTITKSSSWK